MRIGDKMRKKGEVETMHVVVGAIILLIVFTVSVIIYTQYYGKETGIAKCHIANLQEDCDCDGIANAVDTCPCPNGNVGDKCALLTTCFDSSKCECTTQKCTTATTK